MVEVVLYFVIFFQNKVLHLISLQIYNTKSACKECISTKLRHLHLFITNKRNHRKKEAKMWCIEFSFLNLQT